MYQYSIHEKINYRSHCGPINKIKVMKEKYQGFEKNYICCPKGIMKNNFNWTRIKDILNLPFGEINVTDKIYNYIINKFLTDEGKFWFRLIVKGSLSGDSICFWPHEDSVFEDRYKLNYDDPKIIRLKIHATVAGISVHSDDGAYSVITGLIILPRGSFKTYAQNEIKNNN